MQSLFLKRDCCSINISYKFDLEGRGIKRVLGGDVKKIIGLGGLKKS